ncbi:hypothetical protein L873DRAFT_1819673 [Choiromyces venosus 120613-1]|uniref:Uncharacterized protein n=1 Tax=Choiromyces venosus 120613-1 TaxID=1336337 RepID=A0A3N4J2M8_9PEZI|nr:hypothetical protein L873DRAFT_1819673 [Choiromyces venosus 120613-1]
MSGTAHNNTSQTKKGMATSFTQHSQLKGWTARSKSPIIQQNLVSKPHTLSDITSSSPPQPPSPSLPINQNYNLPPSPKRSHTEAFSSVNDGDLYTTPTAPTIPSSNPHILSPTTSKQQ